MAKVNPPDQKVPEAVAAEVGPATKIYFDEMAFTIYQLFLRTGGGSDIIDNSISISNSSITNSAAANARISQIEKQLLKQPPTDTFLPRLEALSKDIRALQNVPHSNVLPRIQQALEEARKHTVDDLSWRPRFVEVDKRITTLENFRPQSELARINELVKENQNLEQLVASLSSQIGRLNGLVDALLKGIPDVIVIKSADHSQTKFDDYIVISGTQTVTLIDPALAFKSVVIRNNTGSAATLTITASTGTTETTSLTDGQAQRLLPVGSVWTNVD